MDLCATLRAEFDNAPVDLGAQSDRAGRFGTTAYH
jgi:hypothetical protein